MFPCQFSQEGRQDKFRRQNHDSAKSSHPIKVILHCDMFVCSSCSRVSRNTAQLNERRSNKVLLYLALSCVKRVFATARLGSRKRSSWGSPIFAAHKRRRRLLWGRVIFNCLFSKRYIISIEMRRETSAGMDSGAWREFRCGSRFWFTPTRHYYKRFCLKLVCAGAAAFSGAVICAT